MQSVADAWSVEETSSHRSIIANLLVSWKKDNILGNTTFTIGVSTIGGGDVIGANPGAIGSPGQWRYFDESDYLLGLAWERALSMPTGGLAKALAEAKLDNTSGRFLPHYMAGNSELHTAILPRRPFIINAGFNFDGVDQVLPQFAGILTKQPKVDTRGREVDLQGADYIDFFQGRYLDRTVMFTAERTDLVMEDLLSTDLGMATSQYELDTGINVIPFGVFENGTRFSSIFHQLAEAENGHFYQDEEGIFRFENRQHWDSFPHTDIQRIIATAQVLEAEAPSEDHIINVVEIKSEVRQKQAEQVLVNYLNAPFIEGNSTVEVILNFNDPVLAITNPTSGGSVSFYKAHSNEEGTGKDLTANISIKSINLFASAVKIIFQNNSAVSAYITRIQISGRPAQVVEEIYHRGLDESSVTAFEERPLLIENNFIQSRDWANSYAQLILDAFSDPENLINLTIRAIPELQLGDLVSWQGRYWRIFTIKNTLMPTVGFVQELQLLQRTITSYFRIGISTIGGEDKIAP